MGVTSNGLPYPENSDFVADGAMAIKDLAENVDVKAGLWRLTPTSVSGTGASIVNGNVVVSSGGTNFTVNGVFSSKFRAYKLIISDFRTSAPTDIKLALGTSNTGSDHRFAGFFVNTSGNYTGIAGSTGTTRIALPCVARTTVAGACEVTIVSPNLAGRTHVMSTGVDSDSGSLLRTINGVVNNNTQYTSMFFSTDSTETITGCTIQIYGYN